MSCPGLVYILYFWGTLFFPTVPLSTQEYTWLQLTHLVREMKSWRNLFGRKNGGRGGGGWGKGEGGCCNLQWTSKYPEVRRSNSPGHYQGHRNRAKIWQLCESVFSAEFTFFAWKHNIPAWNKNLRDCCCCYFTSVHSLVALNVH